MTAPQTASMSCDSADISVDSTSTSAKPRTTAHVAFLTANDVYKLLPADDGMGGVAQFATLLETVRAQLPTDAHVIVTLNGDFLWRSNMERPAKAELMIQILHALGIEYVVLGNHEFDFGAQRCIELLPTMQFTVFGSNVRLQDGLGLLPCVVDYEIITLPGSGIKMGLFGVLTSNRHEFAKPDDPLVVVESEVDHAKRCVQALQAAGVDVVVAITHTRLAKDRLIARQVPGIHVILGGHDHEPWTLIEKTTLIHKSGCDALWLAQVDLFITKDVEHDHVDVQFGWKMFPNRGYAPHPRIQSLMDAYNGQISEELTATLAVTRTWLDGTRVSLRSQECNLGNLVADAIREGMDAEMAFINGGFIQGERKHRAGFALTRAWLQEVLPIPNYGCCLLIKADALRSALLSYFRKFPEDTSMRPHVSGVFLVITIHFVTKKRELRMYRDREHRVEIQDDEQVRVASSPYVFEEAEGCEFFKHGEIVRLGPTIRELVASFLLSRPNGEIAYAEQEGRVILHEE